MNTRSHSRIRPRANTLAWLAVFACVALPGCFPYAASYVHVEGEGGTAVLELCRISGPPVGVRYERLGARLELVIEPGALSRTKAPYLSVRVARGRTVSVSDTASVLSANGTRVASVVLQPVQRPTIVRAPGSKPPPQLPPESLPYETIRFELVGMPAVDRPGTLELPPISIDGVETRLPPIRYERRHFAGVAPLNC